MSLTYASSGSLRGLDLVFFLMIRRPPRSTPEAIAKRWKTRFVRKNPNVTCNFCRRCELSSRENKAPPSIPAHRKGNELHAALAQCQSAFANWRSYSSFLSFVRKDPAASPLGHNGSPLHPKTTLLPPSSR